jgi:hypothetical protein
MFYLFILVFLAIFLYGVQKGLKKNSKPDEYPVTIIKDGKSVTVNGFDRAALKKAFSDAGLKTDDDAHEGSHAGFRQTDIVWNDKYPKGVPYRLEYCDRHGEVTERDVLLISHSGTHPSGHEYIGAIQGGVFKTFRKDRVIRLERVAE